VTLTLDRSPPAPDDQPATRKAAPTPPTSRGLAGLLPIGACASIAAGIIHAGAIASHSDHRAAVWVFVATTVVQLAWGAYALARPSRPIALSGVVISAAALGGWIIAKRWGLWFIDGLSEKEPIQLADGLCALLAGVTMLAASAALLVRRHALPRAAVVLLSLAALLSASLGTVRALDHQHPGAVSVAEPAPAVPPHPFDPALPIDLGGVPGVTPQEQARAENLLADTLLHLPQWSDPALDEANGFFSIHDGVTVSRPK